jgi:O-antigen/teichoic acid export membrane protein
VRSWLARAGELLHLKETSNLAWLLGEYGVRFVIDFLVAALIARHLGPTNFAPYALLFTLIELVVPLTDAGLNSIISRAVLVQEQTLPRILGTGAALRFVTCLIGIPVLAALAYFSGQQYQDLVQFAVIAGVLNSLSCLAVLDYYFQSQLEARRSVIARVLATGVIASIEITLLLMHAHVHAFLWTLCIEQPLFGIMYYVVHRMTDGLPFRRWRVDLRYAAHLFSRSLRLNVSAIASGVSFRIPAIILARNAPPATVGIWGVASDPVELFLVLPNAMASTIFPRMVASRQEGDAEYNRFLKRGYALFSLCGLAIALGLVVLASLVVAVLYGPAFAGAVPALRLYAFILPFVFFRAFMSKWLVLEEHYWLSVGSQVLGAVTAVVAGQLLISWLESAPSAALTTLLACVASSILALGLSRSGRQLLWMLARKAAPADPELSTLTKEA